MLKRSRCSVSALCVDERWPAVEEAVRCIFNEHACRFSFQFIYHAVFQLCQDNAGALVFARLEKLFAVQCAQLRDDVLGTPTEQLIEVFLSRYAAFALALRRVAEVFLYFDHSRTRRGDNLCVSALGERTFRSLVVSAPPMDARLRTAFVALLQRLPRETTLLHRYSAVIQHVSAAALYQTLVEEPYIDTVRSAVLTRVAARQETTPLPGLLAYVAEAVRAECRAAGGVLSDASINKLNVALCIALVGNCRHLFFDSDNKQGGCASLFEAGETQALQTLAELHHCAGDVTSVPAALSSALCARVRRALEERPDNAVGMCDVVRSVLVVCSQLETVRRHLGRLVDLNVAQMERDLGDVLNKDKTFVECICAYIDTQLRQHDLSEEACGDLVMLMRMVRDKESLEAAIRNRIALRLIAVRPHVMVVEKKVIECLKESSGASTVEKLEHMMSDVQDSAAHEHLLEVIAADGICLPLDFHVAVLTEGFWPHFPSFTLRLTSGMTTCMRVFEHYYLARHNGRRLTFHGALGTVFYLLRHKTRTYQVTAQTLMVPAIEALNGDDAISVEALCARTSLDQAEVEGQLGLLAAAQLAVRRDDAFYFNDDFQSERASIRIAAVAHKVARPSYDQQSAHSPVLSSRSKSVDAAIIKLLKSYRSVDFNILCQRVVEMLQPTFLPTVAYIKSRLEQLVEKNYATGGGRSGRYFYCE